MNVKGTMVAIVTIIVGIILTTGVLIPVIQDVSSNDIDTGIKKYVHQEQPLGLLPMMADCLDVD